MDLKNYLRGLSLARSSAVAVAFFLLSAGASLAQDKSTPPNQSAPPDKSAAQQKDEKKSADSATTKLKIQVTATNDKPVSNAAVYVRFNTPGGLFHRDKLAELDFKTNEDGTVKVPEIPRGKILIQVIAKGWHTYGKWYDVETDEETIQIKLEPPNTRWY
jgi:hypothetical protein